MADTTLESLKKNLNISGGGGSGSDPITSNTLSLDATTSELTSTVSNTGSVSTSVDLHPIVEPVELALQAEEARAITSEQTLAVAIADEEGERIAADGQLSSAVSAETQRAQASEFNKQDKQPSAVQSNVAVFDAYGQDIDSGVNLYTDVLDNLTPKKFRGYFPSLADIPIPSDPFWQNTQGYPCTEGDYACYVDSVSGEIMITVPDFWQNTWSGGSPMAAMDPATVKMLYESNMNTNCFTDEFKQWLTVLYNNRLTTGTANRVLRMKADGSGYEWAFVDTVNMADYAVTTDKLGAASVTTDKLAKNSVTSNNIVDGTIATVDIADGAVTTPKLADGAVTTAKIGNSQVTNTQILNGTITTSELADASVSSAKIINSNVTEEKINTDAVTTTKIKNANVTADKIADGAVTVNKIGALAVTEAKIYTGAVTNAKLGASAVTEAKIADANVTTAKIKDGAITNAKVIAGAGINQSKLENGLSECEITVTSSYAAATGYANKQITLSAAQKLLAVPSGFTYLFCTAGSTMAQVMVNASYNPDKGIISLDILRPGASVAIPTKGIIIKIFASKDSTTKSTTTVAT